MHNDHTMQNEENTWRSNWFVRNILSELPIIGAFFHTGNIPRAIHHAAKSTAMIAGGSTAMMLQIIPKDMQDDMTTNITKDITNMAIGMTLGSIAVNIVYSTGNTISQKCRFQTEIINDSDNDAFTQTTDEITLSKSTSLLI